MNCWKQHVHLLLRVFIQSQNDDCVLKLSELNLILRDCRRIKPSPISWTYSVEHTPCIVWALHLAIQTLNCIHVEYPWSIGIFSSSFPTWLSVAQKPKPHTATHASNPSVWNWEFLFPGSTLKYILLRISWKKYNKTFSSSFYRRGRKLLCVNDVHVCCVCVCALYMVRCARLRADTQNETLWIVMTGGMMVRQQPNNKRTNPCTSIGIGQDFQIQCGCLHVSTPTQYVFFVFFSFCYHRYFQRVRQTWTNQQIFWVVILNNRTWYGAAVIPMLIQRWSTVVFCVNP